MPHETGLMGYGWR